MDYYLAPLEGITTYIYRNTYHSIFPPMEKYFTPFLVPRPKKGFSSRERKDILPEHNEGLFVVPQILTNRAEDFIYAARMLMEYGYGEINLNLGCPSGTVVPKGKGAGFLAHPAELERFLDEVFSKLTVRISIKARIGMESPQEFGPLSQMFQKFPLEELIIHPRVRADYYKNQPNLAVFGEAFRESRCPVCYNGDIFSPGDLERLRLEFPGLATVMLGRGIIANPALRWECGRELPENGQNHGAGEEPEATQEWFHSAGEGPESTQEWFHSAGEEPKATQEWFHSAGEGTEATQKWFHGTGKGTEPVAPQEGILLLQGQGTGQPRIQAEKHKKFQQFHEALYQNYQEAFGRDRGVLFKMKEIWHYMIQSFTNYKPYAKLIKKAESLQQYETAVRRLFQEQEVTSHGRFSF